jgi:sulfur relay protein TusB/DsrH
MRAQLKRIGSNDSVIFIQDGCYGLNAPSNIELLNMHGVNVYAIEEDLTARNISSNFNGIMYDDFVQLTLSHNNTISW